MTKPVHIDTMRVRRMKAELAGVTTADYVAAQSEAEFQQAVINLAKVHGWRVRHTRPALTRSGRWATPLQGHPGFVDLVLAKEGRVWFLELKSAKGRVDAEQKAWHEALPPEWTMVLRPGDWETVERILA